MAADPPRSREEVVELRNKHGLHLRPATQFAQLAMEFESDVHVETGGEEVNGKSILMLTSLAAEPGSRLRIRTDGDDADDALRALVALVEARFGEGSGGPDAPAAGTA